MPPKASKAGKAKGSKETQPSSSSSSSSTAAVVELDTNTDTTSGLVVPVFAFEVAKTAAAGLSLSV